MTGRVMRLADGDEMGSIQTDEGFRISFDHSAVMAYDRDHLAVGQIVTFEVEKGPHSRAINVLQMDGPHDSRPGQRHPEPSRLHYMGFEHRGGTRVFRFERIVAGEESTLFLVTANMDLFANHHVGLQEGPALCLHVLTEGSAAATEKGREFRHSLSDRDILAHIARRTISRKRS